jgi:hypothetical protein
MFRLTDICWKRERVFAACGVDSAMYYDAWKKRQKYQLSLHPPPEGCMGGLEKLRRRFGGWGCVLLPAYVEDKPRLPTNFPQGTRDSPFIGLFLIMPSLFPFPTTHRKAMGSFVGGVLPCSTSLLT